MDVNRVFGEKKVLYSVYNKVDDGALVTTGVTFDEFVAMCDFHNWNYEDYELIVCYEGD